MVTMKSLGLVKPGVGGRRRLAEELIDSLEDSGERVLLTAAEMADLDRREELRRNDPRPGIPWEEVMRRLGATP